MALWLADAAAIYIYSAGWGALVSAETDPVFSGSVAAGIDSSDISAWDAAYGWGDHSPKFDGSTGHHHTGSAGEGPQIGYGALANIPSSFSPSQHALIGSLHTVSGLTPGYFLKALTESTYGFAAHGLTYSDVGADASGAASGVQSNLTTHVNATGTSVHGLGSICTQAASSVAITGGTLAGLTGFALRDTSAAYDVTFTCTSSTALGAARALTIDVVNANRTFKLGANLTVSSTATVSGTNSGDQVVPANEAGASHNFLTAYNSSTGAWTKAQPATGDISGLGTIATQAANSVAITGGTLAALTGFALRDTSAAYDVTFTCTSSTTISAARALTIDVVNANRTLKISGNPTISQDYSTTGSPQFSTIELGAATDTTLARVSAGVMSVEGKAVYMAGGATDVAVADGGTNKSSWTQYAIVYASDTTTLAEIAIGATAGYALTVNSGKNGYTWATVLSNPMTTVGDMICGGASGVPSRVAVPGSQGTYWFKEVVAAGGTTVSWASIGQADVSGLTTSDTPTFAGAIMSGGSTLTLSSTMLGYGTILIANSTGGGCGILQFRDSTIYLTSDADGHLDLYGDIGIYLHGAVSIAGTLTLSAQNIATDTTTGMQIATGTTQKIGFYAATPVARQTVSGSSKPSAGTWMLAFCDAIKALGLVTYS